MSTIIQIKRGTTVPAVLANGELAFDATAHNLYIGDGAINTQILSSTTGVTLAQGTAQTIGTTSNRVLKLWATDITATNAIAGSITGNSATVTTNANLTGGVTSVGNAATVITNANLTGVITSVGNATSIASQTGTGTKFVTDTSPVLVTPTLGVAAATSINKVAITQPATSATLTFGTDNATITFQGTDTYVGRATTDTLTNKRITKRIGTETSSTTSTPTGDTVDEWHVTALAVSDTFAAPTGTPTDGQKLIIRIKDNGSAQTLAWNAIYRAGSDVALPTTTVISKTLYCGFIYNTADSKWDLLAVTNNI